MRRLTSATVLTLTLALAASAPARADKPRKPKSALPAQQYPFHETHEKELVTIAAEPCDTKDALPDTRLDYAHHGFLVVRVIVTNDSNAAVNLDDARIHFITADNTVVQAATDEELQRRLFSSKSSAGTRIPLPSPLPDITIHHPPVDQKILADNNDFGFPSTTIAPHTTVAGYLYYDTRNLDEPVLENANLEVRQARFATSSKQLDTFEIPLKPTPNAPPLKEDPIKHAPDVPKPK